MIRAIIVDDERHARESLAIKLADYCSDVEVVASVESAALAIVAIAEHRPDLVFLDIEMPAGDGFRVMESFAEGSVLVVFVTAYKDYAIRALRQGAIDYLLKPIDPLSLQEAMLRVSRLLVEGPEPSSEASVPARLSLPTDDGFELIDIESIVRCRAESNYTRLHYRDGTNALVTRSLGEFEELLSAYQFYRVHHSHLINLKDLRKYHKGRGGAVEMSDGALVEVSARRRDAFLERIAKLVPPSRS